MRQRTWAQSVLTIGTAALWLGAASLQAEPLRPGVERLRFDRESESRTFELTVPDGSAMAQLQVDVRLRRGTVTWVLTDPDGRERLAVRGTDGRIRGDTGEVADPPAGTWKLTMQAEGATAEASILWIVE
jgi:hypothetical protein